MQQHIQPAEPPRAPADARWRLDALTGLVEQAMRDVKQHGVDVSPDLLRHLRSQTAALQMEVAVHLPGAESAELPDDDDDDDESTDRGHPGSESTVVSRHSRSDTVSLGCLFRRKRLPPTVVDDFVTTIKQPMFERMLLKCLDAKVLPTEFVVRGKQVGRRGKAAAWVTVRSNLCRSQLFAQRLDDGQDWVFEPVASAKNTCRQWKVNRWRTRCLHCFPYEAKLVGKPRPCTHPFEFEGLRNGRFPCRRGESCNGMLHVGGLGELASFHVDIHFSHA